MKLRLALILAAALAPSAFAKGACTCQNLESLQQETENAIYEAKFFTDMANELKAIEDHQRDLNKNHPSDRDAGRDVHSVSANERDRMMKEDFHLPHGKVKDYTGPTSVGLINGTCTNNENDLKGLENGASCKEIGTITLEHEAKHRTLCEQMGADAYWLRMPSEIALEEATRYQDQATEMRELLKHVLDGSTVEVETEMTPVFEGQGMRVVYKYIMKRAKLDGKSSPGVDSWTLEGRGERLGTIESVKIPGVTCTSSGHVADDVTMKLDLDGFTMDLDVSSVSKPGDVKLKCSVPGIGQGFGQSMRPLGEGGSGKIFSGEKVQLETEHVEDIAKGPVGQIMAGSGMSVSGEDVTKIVISCPAP